MENVAANDRSGQENSLPNQADGEMELPAASSSGEPSDPIQTEAEVLRRELALFQSELDSIQDRVAAIQRESSSLAETVRRQGEEQAREIVARAEREGQDIVERAMAQAELVELRAKLRAEETRARAVARLWSRLEASRGGVVGGRQVSVEDAMALYEPSPSDVALKEDEDSAEIPSSGAATPAGMTSSSAEGGDTSLEPEGDGAGIEAALVEQRFRTAEPLSFASMMALEDAVRSLPGVASASVEPGAHGAVVLKVVSTNPNNTARLLASTRGLPALQETP